MDALAKLAEAFAKSRGLTESNNGNSGNFVSRSYAKTTEGTISVPTFVKNVLAKKYPKNFSSALVSFVGVSPFSQEHQGGGGLGMHFVFEAEDGTHRIYRIYANSAVTMEDLTKPERLKGLQIGIVPRQGDSLGDPLNFRLYPPIDMRFGIINWEDLLE